MLLTEYNEAEAMELFREEGRREGHEEGLKEGHKKGLKEGREEGLKEVNKERANTERERKRADAAEARVRELEEKLAAANRLS